MVNYLYSLKSKVFHFKCSIISKFHSTEKCRCEKNTLDLKKKYILKQLRDQYWIREDSRVCQCVREIHSVKHNYGHNNKSTGMVDNREYSQN